MLLVVVVYFLWFYFLSTTTFYPLLIRVVHHPWVVVHANMALLDLVLQSQSLGDKVERPSSQY